MEHFDFVVVGGGFAGSVTAMALQQAGKRVALLDRSTHPRFAIGESSTPAAAMLLMSLADAYELPFLKPLAKYGPWQREHPALSCGLKRGFSYFDHRPAAPQDAPCGEWDETRTLLVSANPDAERGDLHWCRSDVDHFLFREASRRLPLVADGVHVTPHRGASNHWEVQIAGSDRAGGELRQPSTIRAQFLIDATGGSDITRQAQTVERPWRTNTAASFGHLSNVGSWDQQLSEAERSGHPFPSDQAAQHHWLNDGWLWMLRFDNGITSVGRVYTSRSDIHATTFPELLREVTAYPGLSHVLGKAAIAPGTSWRFVPRLQRMASQITGASWALLPSAAGVVDPLHSTGIAHSLCGVECLLEILLGDERERLRRLDEYSRRLKRELVWMDQLVGAAYEFGFNFRLFTAATMLYFAAATTFERRRLAGQRPWFRCADDQELVAAANDWIVECRLKIEKLKSAQCQEGSSGWTEMIRHQEQSLRRRLDRWNHVGLCDPNSRNMYRYEVS